MEHIALGPDGTLLCVSCGNLRALDRTTGATRWIAHLQDRVDVIAQRCVPSGKSGHVETEVLADWSLEDVTTDLVELLYIDALRVVLVGANRCISLFSATTGELVGCGSVFKREKGPIIPYVRSFAFLSLEIQGAMHLFGFDGDALFGINLTRCLAEGSDWRKTHFPRESTGPHSGAWSR
jgi:hypothetical protein